MRYILLTVVALLALAATILGARGHKPAAAACLLAILFVGGCLCDTPPRPRHEP